MHPSNELSPQHLIGVQRKLFGDYLNYFLAVVILATGFFTGTFAVYCGGIAMLLLFIASTIGVVCGIMLAVQAVSPPRAKIYDNGYVYKTPYTFTIKDRFIPWDKVLWIDIVQLYRGIFSKVAHYGFIFYWRNEKGKNRIDVLGTNFFDKSVRSKVLKKIIDVKMKIGFTKISGLPNGTAGMQVRKLKQVDIENLMDQVSEGQYPELLQTRRSKVLATVAMSIIYLGVILLLVLGPRSIIFSLSKEWPMSLVFLGIGCFMIFIAVAIIIHIYQERK